MKVNITPICATCISASCSVTTMCVFVVWGPVYVFEDYVNQYIPVVVSEQCFTTRQSKTDLHSHNNYYGIMWNCAPGIICGFISLELTFKRRSGFCMRDSEKFNFPM